MQSGLGKRIYKKWYAALFEFKLGFFLVHIPITVMTSVWTAYIIHKVVLISADIGNKFKYAVIISLYL